MCKPGSGNQMLGPAETLFQRMHEHYKVLMQNPQEQRSELVCICVASNAHHMNNDRNCSKQYLSPMLQETNEGTAMYTFHIVGLLRQDPAKTRDALQLETFSRVHHCVHLQKAP